MVVADPERVERLNEAIQNGQLQNTDGAILTESLQSGLVCEDGSVLYPIRSGLAALVPSEAIPLAD